jgi:hypothetical protein
MSTYSPSLRIQLITTGDQAGVWGTTTNTNLGTLIESAIAGYISVSITSANQAFTALNGAADQSRNMSIALTTTTTAAFAVYAPPAEKTYVIYNASAYVATIYNSTVLGNTTAAGTGVVIPAGKTMTVWSDGTNFRTQNDHLSSLTLASALPVTSGGTGTTTSTGTGSNVLSASPTFTGTPVLPTGATAVTQPFGNSSTALATTAFVQAALQALHPIGSIYINAGVTTNPATLLGFGTWVAFGAGRVPVGLNGADPLFDALEETGGSKDATLVSHTHTITSSTDSAGTHTHNIGANGISASGGGGPLAGSTSSAVSASAGAHTHTVTSTASSAGTSATNANLPPYITVAMWKRTA